MSDNPHKGLHISYCVYGLKPHDLRHYRPKSMKRKIGTWFLRGLASFAVGAIIMTLLLSMSPPGNLKNSIENWLQEGTQVQTMSDFQTVARVAYYCDPPPSGWKVAAAGDIKHLFGKGLTLPPQIAIVTSSKTLADAPGFKYKRPDIFGMPLVQSVFVKAGDDLVTVASMGNGEVKAELVPAGMEFWNCRMVLVKKDWKSPLDIQGDKRVATSAK